MLLHLTHQIEIGGLLIIAGIAAAVIYVLTNEGEGDSILPFAMFGLTSIMGLCLVANAQLKSINSSIDVLETQMAAQHARFHTNKTGATRSYVVGTPASKN